MNHWKTIADIRREYGDLSLNDSDVLASPIAQFQRWFSDILLVEQFDPTAMVLSTVDAQGQPDSRVVLLKGIENDAFLFYTNYNSTKAQQINTHQTVALNFYWPSMARQIRVRGKIKKTSEKQSDDYFSSRPLTSQWSALISPQSSEVSNRESLEKALEDLRKRNVQPIIRPQHWGGYAVFPFEMEFWQGRDNRLHDRIQYVLHNKSWKHHRLAP